MVIGGSMMLAGAAAVAVDFGSIFLAKRKLQGVADAAALSVVGGDIRKGGEGAATLIISRNKSANTRIVDLTPGTFVRDKSVEMGKRFSPGGGSDPTAAQIVLEQNVPLFFARLITGKPAMPIRAKSTAAKLDLAGFRLGTHLFAVSGGVPNKVLSSLAGVELNLDDDDVTDLAMNSVNVVDFADNLRTIRKLDGKTYGEVLNSSVPLDDVITAMGQAAPDGQTRDLLEGIATQVPADAIKPADLVDLGPIAQTDFNDGKTTIEVDAYSLLRGMIALSQGSTWEADVNLAVPGLANTRVRIAGGPGQAKSPWLTVTQGKNVVIRTAKTRVYVETQVGTALAPLATLNIPFYTELASAEAKLDDIRCEGGPVTDGVTLKVKPSIGTVKLASVDGTQLADFSTDLPASNATLASVVGTKVGAYGSISLGGVTWQDVHFTPDEIDARTTKRLSTNDAATATIATLTGNTTVTVTTLLGSTTTSPLAKSVGTTLKTLAPTIDGILNEVTQTLGVKLGVADVQVDRMRCGMPALVV